MMQTATSSSTSSSWPVGQRRRRGPLGGGGLLRARPQQRHVAAAAAGDGRGEPSALPRRVASAALGALLSLQAAGLVGTDWSAAAAAAAGPTPQANPQTTYAAYAAAAHKAAPVDSYTGGGENDDNDDDDGLFTPDAREGMRTLERYWDFVRDVAMPLERTLPECASGACIANRKLLEQAWQVVGNEYFDVRGGMGGGGGGNASSSSTTTTTATSASAPTSAGVSATRPDFTQAWWAAQLLPALTLDGPTAAAAAMADAAATSPSSSAAPSSRPPRGVLTSREDAEAALRWMVSTLGDRYSAYLPPTAWRAALRRPVPANARRYLEAQSVGVGLALGAKTPDGKGRLVESPMAGSPAEESGVLRGDIVLALDGVSAADLSPSAAARVLRGPVGSSIAVTLAPRSRAEGHRQLMLERRPIPQPAVREARLPLPPRLAAAAAAASSSSSNPGAASSFSSSSAYSRYSASSSSFYPPPREAVYLRVNYFSAATTRALSAALSAAAADPGVAGVVLDLRNDPGGSFEEAISDAAMLIGDADAPVAATVRSASGQVDAVWSGSALPPELFTPDAQRAARLSGGWSPGGVVPPLAERPLAVLINRSSASASELLAVALRDNARAAADARQRWQRLSSDGGNGFGSAAPDASTAVVVPRVALIGERTFGKGAVQFYFPLGDDAGRSGGVVGRGDGGGGGGPLSSSSFPQSSPLVASGGGLKLTVAKYVGPRGTDVARDGGVTPDIACKDHPHGVFRGGRADACVVAAMNFVAGF
jgi:C-terminal processing protease CtpA/Prc